ncbi:MAG TPA: CRTAC1 family protein [Cyclobacteriaceae bacterium]|nr:CRTAC1 family protein [Cyclobacteriaceae bacterium]
MRIRTTLVLSVMAISALKAQVEFTHVLDDKNPATKTTSPGFYKGVAWVDIDNDGDVDLFVSPNFLFRNEGKGVFTSLDDPFKFKPMQPPGGASWADLNNDGYIDCIISQNPSGIYLNNGNSTFRNISSQLPGFDSFASWGCAIGNLNGDAFPDFIFAHARGFHKGPMSPSRLYINTSAAVTPQKIVGLAVTDSLKPFTVPYWSDFDQDGDMDLFVASGPGGKPGPDFCYQNTKSKTGKNELTPMTKEPFPTQMQDGQCYNFIDFDNDRDFDLCITNYGGAPSRFYRNDNGTFTAREVLFTGPSNNLSNDWGDFDNDGDMDVVITSDSSKTKLFVNNGDGTFSKPVRIGKAGGSGVSNGDYDNDGDLDLFVNGIDSARVLLNNNASTNGNHWINISLTGAASGKSALGTIVMVKATIHDKPVWQMREINAQNSFMSQNDLRVHFGFGDAGIIDTIMIKYPNSQSKTFKQVKANTFYFHNEDDKQLSLKK